MSCEPGTICPTCDRRVPKPRTAATPESTKVVSFRLPTDRADTLREGLKSLAAVTGAVGASYPMGTLIEALLLLGGENRERLGALFADRPDEGEL